jgi:hypothetical protein
MKRPLIFFSCFTAGSYHKMIVRGRIPILHHRNPEIFLNAKRQGYRAVAHRTAMRYYKPKRRTWEWS